MALVLRKAVLPRNVSLLKCMKGRPLATAANRTNASVVSTAVPSRCKKERKTQGIEKIVTQHSILGDHSSRFKTVQMRLCMSCPSLVTQVKRQQLDADLCWPPTCFSLPKTRAMDQETVLTNTVAARTSFINLFSKLPSMLQSRNVSKTSKRGYASNPCPPCCPPCCPGPCCLPPPCNTPAKCIQYMTGYYYYPYGFWFCGPYHVTGTCVPVGPCSPCKPSPCCPCPPCPPCCPCPKCCACLSSAISPIIGPTATAGEQIKHNFAAAPCQPNSPCQPKPTSQPKPSSQPKQFRQQASRQTCRMSSPDMFSTSCRINQFKVPQLQSAAGHVAQSTSIREKPVTGKTNRNGISKFFPFRVAASATSKPHACLFCPYSTQPHPVCPISKSCMINNMKTKALTPRPIAHFPNYPRRGISGSFSKSFSDYYARKANQRPKSTTAATMTEADDPCIFLESPRAMLSPEQRDWPYVQPNVFEFYQVPDYKKPYPSKKHF